MTYPTIFANLAAGLEPASLLDTMFNIAGGQGNIPTTATGTNAITLTPNTNYYQPASYANYQMVTFKVANTSSGSVTVQLGGLAFVKLFMPSGLQAGSGDLVQNAHVTAVFASDLDTGNGGFLVLNATTPSVVQPVAGGFKNLVITNGGSPDSQIVVTADEVLVENASGGTAKVSSVNVTIATGASGANGLDTGAMANATFYSIWVIYNGSVTAGLISTSATSPTLPSGYTYKARVGWQLTGAASNNLNRIVQKGRRAQYAVTAGSQTIVLPPIFSSSVTTGGPTSRSLAGITPTTASEVFMRVTQASNGANSSTVAVAPNGNYAAIGDSPIIQFAAAGVTQYITGSLLLESAAIFTQQVSAAQPVSFVVSCLGWTDNL